MCSLGEHQIGHSAWVGEARRCEISEASRRDAPAVLRLRDDLAAWMLGRGPDDLAAAVAAVVT
jgi:hypothetical protein